LYGLRGTLPSELFGLVSLDEINLSWNSLTGSLPMSMELTSLREMNLRRNVLTGTLPRALGSLDFFEILESHQDGNSRACLDSNVNDIGVVLVVVPTVLRRMHL